MARFSKMLDSRRADQSDLSEPIVRAPRILLADDDAVSRKLLASALERSGFGTFDPATIPRSASRGPLQNDKLDVCVTFVMVAVRFASCHADSRSGSRRLRRVALFSRSAISADVIASRK